MLPAFQGLVNQMRPLGVHRQVVGGVQGLAVKAVGDYGGRAVGVEADDGAAAGAAAEKVALGVVGQAVGAVGSLAPNGDLVGAGVDAQDAAGRNVGEQQLFAVPDRPLGHPAQGLGQQFESPGHSSTPGKFGGLGW